jgi:selenide,water dikinase
VGITTSQRHNRDDQHNRACTDLFTGLHLARRAILVEPEAAARPELDVLFDPQTSGGMLFGVAPERAAEALEALRRGGDAQAAIVGEVAPPRQDGALIRVVARPT